MQISNFLILNQKKMLEFQLENTFKLFFFHSKCFRFVCAVCCEPIRFLILFKTKKVYEN